MASRNQREGHYVGKIVRRHRRILGATKKRECTEMAFCDECVEWSAKQWLTYKRRCTSWEFGDYWSYEFTCVCLECGTVASYDDSSI